MTRRIALGVILTIVTSIAVRAQDGLTGKWEGETQSGTALVLTLAVKGTVLTGTLMRGEESSPLSDGKVSKNTFTFSATLGGEPEKLSGELTGDELKVWLDRQGPERAVVFRRAKQK